MSLLLSIFNLMLVVWKNLVTVCPKCTVAMVVWSWFWDCSDSQFRKPFLYLRYCTPNIFLVVPFVWLLLMDHTKLEDSKPVEMGFLYLQINLFQLLLVCRTSNISLEPLTIIIEHSSTSPTFWNSVIYNVRKHSWRCDTEFVEFSLLGVLASTISHVFSVLY